jgi:hypothetical protein
VQRKKLFGNIIGDAQTATPPSPLTYLQPLAQELNEINAYAGQFHHDCNPAADAVQVLDTELLVYVNRALNVVHKGAL